MNSMLIYREDSAGWFAAMISEHDQLLADYERIRDANPNSKAVELPFEPGYRPGPLESWLAALSGAMDRLRQHFRDNKQNDELSRYQIARYGELINFGHGGRREWLLAGLREQRRLLTLKLAKVQHKPPGIDLAIVRKRWSEDSWPQKLKVARESRNQLLKEAAAECGVSYETYRKWEEGRPPNSRNRRVILSYMHHDLKASS